MVHGVQQPLEQAVVAEVDQVGRGQLDDSL
jgi:hypothetical protein